MLSAFNNAWLIIDDPVPQITRQKSSVGLSKHHEIVYILAIFLFALIIKGIHQMWKRYKQRQYQKQIDDEEREIHL